MRNHPAIGVPPFIEPPPNTESPLLNLASSPIETRASQRCTGAASETGGGFRPVQLPSHPKSLGLSKNLQETKVSTSYEVFPL